MNTPSPLSPQGSLQQTPRGKSNVRVAVITIIALHGVFFGGLLLQQGCKPKTADPGTGPTLTGLTSTNFDYPLLTNQPYADTTTGFASVPFPDTHSLAPATNFAPGVGAFAGTPSQDTPALPAEPRKYTIAKGDFPAKIAKTHGISVTELMNANPGLDARRLQIGKEINIPAATQPQAAPAPVVPDGTVLYEVKSGDNLTKIAAKYGVTIKALREANNLRTDRINVGQKLAVPTQAAPGAGAPR